MPAISMVDDLYRYNAWANGRILQLCDGLEDAQLDEPREMGFGSLRNTVFHILAAEETWYERWTHVPWRPFPVDADGLPLAEIARRFEEVGANRQALIDRERADGWRRICRYRDSKGVGYEMPLRGLLLHVANHGTYHRAQALHYLKRWGRTVAGGLDYIFYRFVRPHVEQDAATVESMRKYGLEVATGSSPAVAWDAALVRDYFAYGDWCNARLLESLGPLDAAALDHDFAMGVGSLRKTALHIADAERWWLRNWTDGPAAYEQSSEGTTMAALGQLWAGIIESRRRFLDSLDEASAQRLVTGLVGNMSIRLPVMETLLQLGGHGTHHRAQLANMLRHSGITAPASDYVAWLRATSAA